MSDPVTNAEIEDVLSSIRRLVSTDERGKPATPETVSDEQDKLVLTPSQRVDETPEEETAPNIAAAEHTPVEAAFLAQYAVEPAVESDDPETGTETGTEIDKLTDTEADPEAAEQNASDAQPEEGEAPQPEFKHHHEGHSFKDPGLETGASPDAEHGNENAESSTAEASDATDQDADAPSDQAPDAEAQVASEPADNSPDLQARIASVEAALAGRDDEWEPDGDDEDPYAGDQVATLEWEDHASDEGDADAPAEDAHNSRFEAAYDEGFEPDATELADDFTPSASERDDHLDASGGEAPASEKAMAEDDDWQLQGDVLDEDALRDMVSEIVRQELQGALGERITRNVRKLVRREIHRALASQEFE
jgi:hypothetical protein